MGYPSGEVRWGLMAIFRVVGIGIELRLDFITLVVYPGFFFNHTLRSAVYGLTDIRC